MFVLPCLAVLLAGADAVKVIVNGVVLEAISCPSPPPTGLPTSLPTGLPTSLPSGVPSGLPSGLPTSLPTSLFPTLSTSNSSTLRTGPSGTSSLLPTPTVSLPDGLPAGAVTELDDTFNLIISSSIITKRDDQGNVSYLNADGGAGDAQDAAECFLDLGNLFSNGYYVSAVPGAQSAVIVSSDTEVTNDTIISTFAFVNDTLGWYNDAFVGGVALFGMDPNGTVSASFTGALPSGWQPLDLIRTPVVVTELQPILKHFSLPLQVGAPEPANQTFAPLLQSPPGFGEYAAYGGIKPADPLNGQAGDPLYLPGITNFGGVDVTKDLANAPRPGLWNLTSTYDIVQNDFGPVTPSSSKKNKRQAVDYRSPDFLNFKPAQGFSRQTISSETRSSYQQTLSTTFGMSAGAFGFSAEFKDSFSTTTSEETFNKYVAAYTIANVYSLELKDQNAAEMRAHLSDLALHRFANSTPAEIVDAFGTHFMKTVQMGGWKRLTHHLDIRDDSIAESLKQAMEIKVEIKDPELGNPTAGTTYEEATDTVKKLFRSITNDVSQCYGGFAATCDEYDSAGNPLPNSPSWLKSLHSNPAAATYTLERLDYLIIDELDGDGRQAAVAAEIDARLAQQAINEKNLLVIYKPMQYGNNDAGSRAHDSLQVNVVTNDPGWYTLGQYAQAPGPTDDWRNNAGNYQGIQIREAPQIEATAPNSILRKPSGYSQRWSRQSHGRKGFYEMNLNEDSSFAPLSGYFFRDNNIDLGWFGSGVLVKTDYLHQDGTSHYTRQWTDQGSGASDDGSLWAVRGPNDMGVYKDSITPTDQTAPFFFHSTGGYDNAPPEAPWQLDFSKVAVLSDNFLAGLNV
ncbi:hypothetical protein CONLIGDRAFT_677361 [Coniochaeta ligniaria NRRL 30616]|uniref:Uncharacterized protein n=1 Tax=Coniochaeta ligniaria NRRL 30616 TaxID=1408157 RepID=A0A1J7J0J9_9PEZI|nr:hypothetical protein CONLIGDRAFT_677361 [Coniochaeta ligniaria NRRL 30616]